MSAKKRQKRTVIDLAAPYTIGCCNLSGCLVEGHKHSRDVTPLKSSGASHNGIVLAPHRMHPSVLLDRNVVLCDEPMHFRPDRIDVYRSLLMVARAMAIELQNLTRTLLERPDGLEGQYFVRLLRGAAKKVIHDSAKRNLAGVIAAFDLKTLTVDDAFDICLSYENGCSEERMISAFMSSKTVVWVEKNASHYDAGFHVAVAFVRHHGRITSIDWAKVRAGLLKGPQNSTSFAEAIDAHKAQNIVSVLVKESSPVYHLSPGTTLMVGVGPLVVHCDSLECVHIFDPEKNHVLWNQSGIQARTALFGMLCDFHTLKIK